MLSIQSKIYDDGINLQKYGVLASKLGRRCLKNGLVVWKISPKKPLCVYVVIDLFCETNGFFEMWNSLLSEWKKKYLKYENIHIV